MEAARSTAEEVLDTRTPQEIEAEMLKKANEQALEAANSMKPEEVAAFYFQSNIRLFDTTVKNLSSKDAKRVAIALVQFPLEDSNPKFNSEQARLAFNLGLNLLDCKQIMKSIVEYDRFQELHNQKEAAENLAAEATVEVIRENNQGENNGTT